MNTNQQQIEEDVIPDKNNIPRMVDAALHVMLSGLFYAASIDPAKTEIAKSLVWNFITRTEEPYKNFADFFLAATKRIFNPQKR